MVWYHKEIQLFYQHRSVKETQTLYLQEPVIYSTDALTIANHFLIYLKSYLKSKTNN